jgi:hypothetical protein
VRGLRALEKLRRHSDDRRVPPNGEMRGRRQVCVLIAAVAALFTRRYPEPEDSP